MGRNIPLGWQGGIRFCCSWEEFEQEIFAEKINASGVNGQEWCWGRALVEQILGWLSWKPVGDVPQSPGACAEAAFIHLCVHLVTWDRVSQTGSRLHLCAGLFLSPLSGKTNKLFTQCFFKVIVRSRTTLAVPLEISFCLCKLVGVKLLSLLCFAVLCLCCLHVKTGCASTSWSPRITGVGKDSEMESNH